MPIYFHCFPEACARALDAWWICSFFLGGGGGGGFFGGGKFLCVKLYFSRPVVTTTLWELRGKTVSFRVGSGKEIGMNMYKVIL